MSSSNITAAISILEELNSVLDSAYWESNTMNTKDTIYDCINAVNKELSELNKLSIQDHDLLYEPISHEFKIVARRIPTFRRYLKKYIMRSATLSKLDASIAAILQLITTPSTYEL